MAHPLNTQGLKLNTYQKTELELSALSDFVSIMGTIGQGIADKQSYSFMASQSGMNVDLLRQNAQDILQAGYDYENKVREQGLKVRGKQRTAMSASGFDVNSKSYQDVIGQTDYNIARNTAAIRREAMSKYSAVNMEANLADIQSKLYKQAGKSALYKSIAEGLTGGLTGALKLSMINKYSKSPVVDVTGTAKDSETVKIKNELYKG